MTVFATSARPRRSVLYMPASKARALEKGRTLDADGLIFDLEDAVAPAAKATARAAATAAAGSGTYGAREVLIRCNGLDTEWAEDDLAAAASSDASGVIVPKVNGPDDIRRADALLNAAGARPELALWAMMETPRGILNAAAIAVASPRMTGFIVGTNDLAKDLRCTHDSARTSMLHALQHSILVARACGLAILDGVHPHLEDEEGFAEACRQGRALGFDGKTLLHPRQIAVANRTFAPSSADLEQAERIIAAYRQAAAKGDAVTLLDGRLVEKLHVLEAERLLTQAATIAARSRI